MIYDVDSPSSPEDTNSLNSSLNFIFLVPLSLFLTRLLLQVLLFHCKFNVDRSLTCRTCTCPVFSSQHEGLRLKTFDLPSCLLYDPLVSSSRMCPLERILSCLSRSSLPHSRPASAAAAAWNELQRRRRRCLSSPAATSLANRLVVCFQTTRNRSKLLSIQPTIYFESCVREHLHAIKF